MHYRARAYSPRQMRFLQNDPPVGNRAEQHYAYVANNPVSGTDPEGMQDPPGPTVDPKSLIEELLGPPQEERLYVRVLPVYGYNHRRSVVRSAITDRERTVWSSVSEVVDYEVVVETEAQVRDRAVLRQWSRQVEGGPVRPVQGPEQLFREAETRLHGRPYVPKPDAHLKVVERGERATRVYLVIGVAIGEQAAETVLLGKIPSALAGARAARVASKGGQIVDYSTAGGRTGWGAIPKNVVEGNSQLSRLTTQYLDDVTMHGPNWYDPWLVFGEAGQQVYGVTRGMASRIGPSAFRDNQVLRTLLHEEVHRRFRLAGQQGPSSANIEALIERIVDDFVRFKGLPPK